MKKAILSALLIVLAISQGCGAGGVMCQQNKCHFPAYIEGCYTYLNENECDICEYRKGCTYSPNANSTDCCVSFDSNNICNQCKNGLIINKASGLCVDVKIPGCIQKDQNGCINCASNYNLVGQKCVKKVSGCAQYDSNNMCTACNQQYTLVQGACSPNTLPCSAPFAMVNGSCQLLNCKVQSEYGCSECLTGYVASAGQCVAAPIRGCASYNSDQTCARCDELYFELVSGSCRMVGCSNYDGVKCQSCNSAVGFSANNNRCEIPSCVYFDDLGCKQCVSGMYPTPNGCVASSSRVPVCTACGKNQYVGTDGNCHQMDPGCVKYSAGVCMKCATNYHLDSTSRKCQQNLPGCIYDNKNVCSSCSSPFHLDSSNAACVIDGCLTYGSNGCQTCNTGFVLNPTYGCCDIPHCATIKNSVCVQCVSDYVFDSQNNCVQNDVNCNTKNAFGQCLKCNDGYQVGQSGLCVKISFGCNYVDGVCTSCRAPFTFVPTTQTCIIDGCITYFVGGCTTCDSRYTSTYNGCTLPNCLVSQNGTCLQCNPDYVFRSDGTCVNKDEYCQKMDAHGTCIQCMDTYYYSKKLQKCQKKSPGCEYDENDLCCSCNAPFTFKQNQCGIAGCLTLADDGCSVCQYPFVLANDKTCILPNCDLYKDGACVACKAGFVKNSQGLCVNQDPNCLQYDAANTNCLRCIKGYTFDSNGQCQFADAHCWDFDNSSVCENCDRLYFLNPYFVCQIRDPNCVTYTNGYCTQCHDYFFVSSGLCMQNLKGCKIQQTYQNCLHCEDGYDLNNGKCTASITRLDWNSIDMDFLDSSNASDQQIAQQTFTPGIDCKVNLSPVIESNISTIFYSSCAFKTFNLQINSAGDDGWSTASANCQGQFIGVTLQTMETFYAMDIKSLNGNQLTDFSIQYSENGINYTKVNDFALDNSVVNSVQTIYFTPFYGKSVRLVVTKGLPNIKVEFYYHNKQTSTAVSAPNQGTFIGDSTAATLQSAQSGKDGLGGIQQCSGNNTLCWMGMESCSPKSISAFALTFSGNEASLGSVTQFSIDYSVDGLTFECWNGCKSTTLQNNCYNFSTPILAAKFRVHFTAYTGKPKFGIAFTYQ